MKISDFSISIAFCFDLLNLRSHFFRVLLHRGYLLLNCNMVFFELSFQLGKFLSVLSRQGKIATLVLCVILIDLLANESLQGLLGFNFANETILNLTANLIEFA